MHGAAGDAGFGPPLFYPRMAPSPGLIRPRPRTVRPGAMGERSMAQIKNLGIQNAGHTDG
jgi:hypothetical protein